MQRWHQATVTNTCDDGEKRDWKKKCSTMWPDCGNEEKSDQKRSKRTEQKKSIRVVGVTIASLSREDAHTTGICILRAFVLAHSPSYNIVSYLWWQVTSSCAAIPLTS